MVLESVLLVLLTSALLAILLFSPNRYTHIHTRTHTHTGITNVATSVVTGNMGVSPIAAEAITG
jgi:hypothetical protein